MQKFHPDDTALGVVIENDPWLALVRFNDGILVQLQVEGLAFFVNLQLHGRRSFIHRPKNAVTIASTTFYETVRKVTRQ